MKKPEILKACQKEPKNAPFQAKSQNGGTLISELSNGKILKSFLKYSQKPIKWRGLGLRPVYDLSAKFGSCLF